MSDLLRIALLTHSVLPRGAVVHTLELAEALAERGHAVTVVAPVERGQQLFRETSCRVALIPQPELSGKLVGQVAQRIAALERGLPAVLRDTSFDLLHAQDSLSGNALALLASQAARALPPWVRTVHHLDEFREPELAAWQSRGWQMADSVGCVSDTWCERLRATHGVRAQRLFNGVNLARFQPRVQTDDAELTRGTGLDEEAAPLCLAIGGVEQRKNSVRLLQAFARLRAADPAWSRAQLVVAGGASLLDHSRALHDWSQALDELGWSEGPGCPVLRTGPVSDALLAALMRRARLLALPSLVEGFGLVALEALACGTPVLVSQRAPFTEHLSGNPHVAWCDPVDTDSIAGGLRRAAALPRPTTPPEVCMSHSWSLSALRHEQWYQSVLRNARRLPARDPAPRSH